MEHLYSIPHSIGTTIIIQLRSLGSLLPRLASEECVFTFNRINCPSQSYCQWLVCLSFESDMVNRVGKVPIFSPMFDLCNVVLPPCGSFIVNSETKAWWDKANQGNHRGFGAEAEGEMEI